MAGKPGYPENHALQGVCRRHAIQLLLVFMFVATFSLIQLVGESQSAGGIAIPLPQVFVFQVPALDSELRQQGAASGHLRVFMYDLPPKFSTDIQSMYWENRGHPNATAEDYPNHQHMGEWYIYQHVKNPPPTSLVVRVTDPEDADVFYVPFFSSLLLKAAPIAKKGEKVEMGAMDNEQLNHQLFDWLEATPTWQRSRGRDHVIPAQHPNALRLWAQPRAARSVLLVSDFDHAYQGQDGGGPTAFLAKDVVVPYIHRMEPLRRTDPEANATRSMLAFFIGARRRKGKGHVRNQLFDVLATEEGVVLREGKQTASGVRNGQAGMRASKFCLHPVGDTASSGRLFDAIVSICVPVIISDDIELPFEGALDYRKFAVFVPREKAVEPGYLVKRLQAHVADGSFQAMQDTLWDVQKYFVYAGGEAVNMIWREVAGKLPSIRQHIARDQRMVPQGPRICSCHCSNDGVDRACPRVEGGSRTHAEGPTREESGEEREEGGE